MRYVARSAILLEPHVIGIHIIHFRPQEVAYHRSVALAVGYGNAHFGRNTDWWFRQTKIRTKQWLSRDAFGAGVSRHWYRPKFDNFACSHIHSSKNASSLKMICLAKFGLTFNCSRTQSANTQRCLPRVVYLKFLSQLNFIKVQIQVPTQNSPSWNRRKAKFLWREIDRLEFSRTFSRTATMFLADLAFRRCTGGWLFIESVDSNLATKRRIVDSAGQLWRG